MSIPEGRKSAQNSCGVLRETSLHVACRLGHNQVSYFRFHFHCQTIFSIKSIFEYPLQSLSLDRQTVGRTIG
jgi:hypothetical protein